MKKPQGKELEFTILRFVSGVSGALSTFLAEFAAADTDCVEGCSKFDISLPVMKETRPLPLYTLPGVWLINPRDS